MKIAIEGCAHGELDTIYSTIKALEAEQNMKIDLLICCGDFQSTRNQQDLFCMAVPPKYYNMCSFYKYYNGEKKAPILTVFIGGNHEASNYLQELPFGGWVAPNIYYMGYANVINIGGVRIGGISGIYKGQDYLKGHFESSPYSESTKRSVYHIRNLEIFRLKQISQPIDIFISHDWPSDVCQFGNFNQLIRFKPFLKNDINSGKLGSKPCSELLNYLQPSYWFSAHLHCKFAAVIPHSNGNITKFLALDKCLPKRRFLQIVDIPHDKEEKFTISYDLEWLTILSLTNHLLCVKSTFQYMPSEGDSKGWKFTPTKEEKNQVRKKFKDHLLVPNNFIKTVEGYNPNNPQIYSNKQPLMQINPQTTIFCETLGIDDPVSVLLSQFSDYKSNNSALNFSAILNDSNLDKTADFSTFKVSRTSLSLPEPKLSLSELDNESSKCDNLEKSSDSLNFDSVNINSSDTSTSQNCTAESVGADSPLRKKFKRRNANIYCDEES